MHIHKRCVCCESLVICPVCHSHSCQDAACHPLAVMLSALSLFGQRRRSTIHLLYWSWHERTEVYSQSLQVLHCATITRDMAMVSPPHFPNLTGCYLLCVEGNKIKSKAVPGAFVPSSLLHCAPLVTLILRTYRDKLLEQTCIMRGQRNTQGKEALQRVSFY